MIAKRQGCEPESVRLETGGGTELIDRDTSASAGLTSMDTIYSFGMVKLEFIETNSTGATTSIDLQTKGSASPASLFNRYAQLNTAANHGNNDLLVTFTASGTPSCSTVLAEFDCGQLEVFGKWALGSCEQLTVFLRGLSSGSAIRVTVSSKVLNLEVRSKDTNHSWHFKVKSTTKLSKVFAVYAQTKGIGLDNVVFSLQSGAKIEGSATAETLGLENDSVIFVESNHITF